MESVFESKTFIKFYQKMQQVDYVQLSFYLQNIGILKGWASHLGNDLSGKCPGDLKKFRASS